MSEETTPRTVEEAEVLALRSALVDVTAAWRIAAEAADRLRDVVAEALGLDENPGDDALVGGLREVHGKEGPEPRRWRDFLTGAVAHVERTGGRWLHDVTLSPDSGEEHPDRIERQEGEDR